MKTFLIIDDNEDDHYITEDVCRELYPDARFLNCYDGREALDLLSVSEEIPELIFLDINMPGMNGIEFLKHYNATEQEKINVAVLSSSGLESDKNACLQYDFVKGYFSKSLKRNDVETLSGLC